MKRNLKIFAVIAVVLTIAFTACKKKPTTGGLIVKIQVSGSSGTVQGALVGLSTSQANLDNSIYIQDKTTDANGQVDFGQLKPGTYFYDGFYDDGNDSYYNESSVTIVAGKDEVKTLTLE